MLGISKVMVIVAIVITSLMYWATTNVCRYNFTIEKKTNELNIIAAELVPALPLTEVYYFRELNCNDVNLTWDYERVMRNLNALSVILYLLFSWKLRSSLIFFNFFFTTRYKNKYPKIKKEKIKKVTKKFIKKSDIQIEISITNLAIRLWVDLLHHQNNA